MARIWLRRDREDDSMDTSALYDVKLIGFPKDPGPRATEALKQAFGIDEATAARIISSVPVVVKHAAPATVARQYGQALESIGGKVAFLPSSSPPQKQSQRPSPPAPSYGVVSTRLPAQKDVPSNPPHRPKATPSFFQALPGAFVYPFKGSGVLMLVVGGLFFAIVGYVASVSIFGWLAGFFVSGYLAAYMLRVLSTSADGDKEPPMWPDFTSFWDDILRPMFQVYGTFALSFVPVGGYLAYRGISVSLAVDPVLWLLVAVGLFYFPAALLSVAVRGSIGGANPLLVLRAIAVCWKEYPVAVFTVALLYLVGMIVNALPALYLIPATIVSLWLLMTEMRILGLLCHTKQEKLDWL